MQQAEDMRVRHAYLDEMQATNTNQTNGSMKSLGLNVTQTGSQMNVVPKNNDIVQVSKMIQQNHELAALP